MGCWFTTNHQRSPCEHQHMTTGHRDRKKICFYFSTPCNSSCSIARQEAVVRKWPTLSQARRVLVLKKKETGQWSSSNFQVSSAETKLRQNLKESRHFLFQLINISRSKKHPRTRLIRPLFSCFFHALSSRSFRLLGVLLLLYCSDQVPSRAMLLTKH